MCVGSQLLYPPEPGWFAIQSAEGVEMQRVNVFPFYQLGWRLHALSDIEEDASVKEWQGKLYSAQMWLEHFLEGNVVLLNVSKGPGEELLKAIRAAVEPPSETMSLAGLLGGTPAIAPPPADKKLSWSEAYHIRNGVRTFETVLAADLETLSVYFVSRKLGYDTRLLIEDASILLPVSLNSVPDETNQEFKHLGKCIAFDLPTAAAFHTIRATEAVIRKYYEAVVKTKPKPKTRNWGTYIKNLKKCGADPKVTSFLDHIRETYRNPILHPEETLESDEAQILLGVCNSAIVMMAKAISDIEQYEQLNALARITKTN